LPSASGPCGTAPVFTSHAANASIKIVPTLVTEILEKIVLVIRN
jgi:hypothetical protein